MRRLLVSATLIGVMASAVVPGVALAHVASGLFSHSFAVEATHSAGVGDFNCGTSWVKPTGLHQSYDSQSHFASLWTRDYYSGASWSTTWGFQSFGNSTFHPQASSRIDAFTSSVSPIHSWHDLVYPRYQHAASVACGA
jgi:hypothetical protein